MMKRFYLLITAFLSLAACKKEAELQLGYPSLYRTIRYENTSQVRLYTRNGEVTDRAVVNHFTGQHGQGYLYNNGIVIHIDQTNTDSVRILSPASAEIKEGGRFKEYGLTIRKNDLQFIPKDTFSMFGINEYLSGINLAVGRHKPFYHEKFSVPSTTGTTYLHRMAVGRYAVAAANHLDFPMLNYVITQGAGPYQSGYSHKNFNNTFDQTAYLQLKAGDTLAVQEFKLRFEKQGL